MSASPPLPALSWSTPVKAHQLAALAVATLTLSACSGSNNGAAAVVAEGRNGETASVTSGTPRVVVAVIDSTINPYHEHFHAGSALYPDAAPSSVTPALLEAFGIGPNQILKPTRSGDFAADFAADQAFFDRILPGQAVWYEGTNIIAVSFDGGFNLNPAGKSPHGTGVTSSVLNANPEAVVVFIEGVNADSENFAFSHPEVDIVTTSYGLPGSVPVAGEAIAGSYTGVVDGGKLHFGAADNSPALSPFDGTSGPWWSIGVAGFEEGSSNGRQLTSGTFPDFIADFTQDLPYCVDCQTGTSSVGGTSFATPTSAGIASKILLETRRSLGHRGGIVFAEDGSPLMARGPAGQISNWQLRRALEQAAWIPDAGSYDPTVGITDLVGIPVPPGAPWLVAGWGLLSSDPGFAVVPSSLAVLGVPGAPEATPAEKDAGFCLFQTENINARKLFWDQINPLSPSFQNAPATDPFLYC